MARSSRKSIVLILVVLAFAVGGGYYWFEARGLEKTDDAAIEGRIVPIAAKVPGYVVELPVQDNQPVKQGDVILKIDPRDYNAALLQAQADLASAEARLIAGQHNNASTSVSAPSNLESAQSQLALAEAEWKIAQTTLNRLKKLNDEARSRQSLDDAAAEEKTAHSRYNDAVARLKSAETAPDEIAASEAGVKDLIAAVDKARAAVQRAQNDLDDTVIKAPRDGRISRRTVEAGAYIQPGQQLLSLVGNDYWVIANFKETQLKHMKPGQAVDIEIDAYPGQDYHGKVDSIQSGTGARFSLFPPENATGNFVKIVQRVPVKITFDSLPSAALPIGPGMSVVPAVHVE